jgi:hypothetical protein
VLDAPTVNNSVVPILDRKRLVHVGNVGGVLVIRFVERFYGCGSKVPNQQLFAIGSVSGASLQIECALQFVYWNVNFLPSDGGNASKRLFSPRELQKVQHVDIDSHRQDSFRWGIWSKYH